MSWISVITNEGNAMIAELAGGGHTLTFTKSCIGSGYVAAENMRVQTALQSYKQDCAIAEIRAMTGGGGQNIRNRIGPATALVGAFTGHEIGVWAKVDNGEEKMFLLSQDTGTGVSVPLESSDADFFFDVVTPFLFFGSATIIATVDRTLYASLQDLDDATELLYDNFAPEYDETETYYNGDYCIHEGILCYCKVSTKSPGPWSVTDWDLVNVGSNLKDIQKYQLPSKADKSDTVLSTTLSRGRKSGTTVGTGSFAFGNNVEASGVYSFAEGDSTKASGQSSHAEGTDSQATEETAHAEGYDTKSSHVSSHAEGSYTEASNYAAHAEGMSTKATGMFSHAEGDSSVASGESSHAEGRGTLASGDYQHAGGKYNIDDPNGTYAEIIGNGSSSTRANMRALDWNGNERLKGDVYVNCDPDSGNGTALGAAVSALSSNKMDNPNNTGAQGQILQNDGNGGAEWANVGTPSDAQVGTAVSTWLAAHPEATTTVQDGAISRAKLDADLKEKTDAVPDLKSAISASNRIDNDRLKDVDGLKYIGELLATKRSSGYSNYEISLTASKRYKLFVQTTGGYKVFLRGSDATTQVNFWFDNASVAYMAEVSGTGDHYLVPVSNASYIRITDNTTSDVRITVYEITTEGINEDISGLQFDADIDQSRLYGLDGLQFVGKLTAKAKKAAYENYAVSLSNMVTYKMYVDTDSTFALFAKASDETTGIYCSVDGGEFVLQNSLSGSGEHTLQCNGSVSYIRITDNTTNDVRIEFYFDTGRNVGNLAPDTKTINCYGDSLTMGYGGEGTTFPSVLDGLLDSTYTVNNYGIGGETAQQIAGRQGGVPLIVSPVTLTHNSATTVIIKSYFGSDIDALFKQASGGKNPIMLNGHQVSQMYDGNNNTLWCYNNETLVVNRPSVLLPYSATQRNKTIIIWIGTNGWGNNSDVNTLVRMIDAMIEYNGNDNYIVIGLVTGENMPTFRASEQLFIETYGYHYIALREYLVNYGCSDAGITPTAEDQERAAQGLVPSSLLVDGVHFNAAGYTVIGTLVHKRGQELGLW